MALKSNLHIIPGSNLDNATLTVTPAPVATLPATNMQKQGRGKIARILGTYATIAANNAVGTTADGFALANHNLETTATVRLRLYDEDDQAGKLVYDSGVVPVATIIPWGVMRAGLEPWGAAYDATGLPKIFSLWFDLVAYKSVLIDIYAPDNSQIDIGRLFLGSAFVPSVNYNYGASIEWVDNSKHTRTAAGSLRTQSVVAYRRFTYDLSHLNNAERERLSFDLERVTKRGDMLVCLDPTATGRSFLEQTMIAKRVSNNAISHTHSSISKAQHIFEEA